jgi:hypothetical protein
MLKFLNCFYSAEEKIVANGFPFFVVDLFHYIGTQDVVYAILSFKFGLNTVNVRVYNHQTLIMHSGKQMFHNTFPYEKLCHHYNLSEVVYVTIVINHADEILLYRSVFQKYSSGNSKMKILIEERT